MSTTEAERFVSPYDDPAPEGAEGWEELYPYYLRFREDRREFEEGRFWFADLQHWPTVFKPFDTITVEFAIKCLGQYNTRHLLIPPANGIDYRVHNGYVYMSPVPVPEEEIPGRVPQFAERAGHYFENWNSLLANWETKVRRVIADLEALEFEPLPEVVPLEWIKEGVGLDNTFALGPELRPGDRALLRGLPVPLRVPQPRLRRLPGLLHLLQGGPARRRRPGHRQDGAGHRRRPLPPRRGAAHARPAGGGAGGRRRAGDGAGELRRERRWRRWPPRPGGEEWLAAWRGGAGPVVQLLLGQRHVQHRPGVARPPGDPAGLHPRLRRPPAAPARRSTAPPRRSAPSATGSPPSTASCCPTTTPARCSTASSAWPARSSPMSRTTTSTSSTGRCRSSGARSARSARCWPTPASGARPTTSSTSAATSCSR